MSGRVFLGACRTRPKQGLMCLAKGHNAVMLVRLKFAALQSRIKRSTTEPLRSPPTKYYQNISKGTKIIEPTSFFRKTDRQAPGCCPSILKALDAHMFRGECGLDKMLTDATRVVHYQVGGCIGGDICYRCDSRLTGAVVYHKDIVKADTLYK